MFLHSSTILKLQKRNSSSLEVCFKLESLLSQQPVQTDGFHLTRGHSCRYMYQAKQ